MNYISPINNYLNVSHIKSKNIFLSKKKKRKKENALMS